MIPDKERFKNTEGARLRILIAIGVPREKEAGAAAVVLNNAAELVKRGHAVDCWFLDDLFQHPPRPKRLEPLLFAFSLARRILRQREKYDVVNLHAPSGCLYGFWRRLFGPSTLPPYVLTMQGSEERFVHTMKREHRKRRAQNFGFKNRIWHRIFHQTMYDYSISTADYGTVANRESQIIAEIKYDRDPGKFRYVPNGTEGRFFVPRTYPEKPTLRLLYVGTWIDRKGIYYLKDAFEVLIQRMPGIELTVAGSLMSEERVRSFFAPTVRESVRVIPFLRREEMPELYATHDVFVFPSLMEGMPLTLLEAMASGMPVVTTNTCGMADIVEDELDGLLVPVANPDKLADAVERLCKSVKLRSQIGQEAQRKMRRFTWEKVTSSLESALFLAVLENRRVNSKSLDPHRR